MSRGRLWALGLTPSTFPLSRVVTVYLQNQGEIPLIDTARPALLSVALAGLVSALFYRLYQKNPARMVLASALFWIVFLAQGRTEALLAARFSPLSAHLLGLVGFLVLVAGIALAIQRLNRGLSALQSAATAMSVFILLTPVVQHLLPRPGTAPTLAVSKSPLALKGEDTPDIYCIVLDSYGRADILKDLYGTDNSGFLAQLRQLGFTVPSHSRANYIETTIAIPSLLNLDYLENIHLGESLAPTHPDWPRRAVDENRTAQALRAKGYQFVAISCGFLLTQARTADRLYDPERASTPLSSPLYKLLTPQFTPIESLLLVRTPLAVLDQSAHQQYAKHRRGLHFAFESLAATTKITQPKFVFAHILLPHTPFVFTAEGAPRNPSTPFSIDSGHDYKATESVRAYRDQYAQQLQYTNTRILESLQAILAQNQRPTVIVLLGDHGPRSSVDWDHVERTDLKEAYGNLMAFRLLTPGDAEKLPSTISPVNALRFVLSTYFEASLPPLPNKSFLSTVRVHEPHPQEITAKVEAALAR